MTHRSTEKELREEERLRKYNLVLEHTKKCEKTRRDGLGFFIQDINSIVSNEEN